MGKGRAVIRQWLDIYCQTGQNPVSAWIRTAGLWKRPVGAHGSVRGANRPIPPAETSGVSVSASPGSRACVCSSRGISGHQDWRCPGEPMPIPRPLRFLTEEEAESYGEEVSVPRL